MILQCPSVTDGSLRLLSYFLPSCVLSALMSVWYKEKKGKNSLFLRLCSLQVKVKTNSSLTKVYYGRTKYEGNGKFIFTNRSRESNRQPAEENQKA